MKERVRVTFTLPRQLWEEVKNLFPAGKRSRLVAEAIEREIRIWKRMEGVKRLKKLQSELRRKYRELPSSAEEIQALREDRDAQITGLC